MSNSYLIEFGVCYLTLCEKSYPKKLAFTYLEELQKEFHEKYGQEVGTVARPYAFVKFDSFIQKTKRQYKDARAQRNLQKLNDDLHDVTRIMTKNIQDVLGRGETLDRTYPSFYTHACQEVKKANPLDITIQACSQHHRTWPHSQKSISKIQKSCIFRPFTRNMVLPRLLEAWCYSSCT
jgi:hypothetical protein